MKKLAYSSIALLTLAAFAFVITARASSVVDSYNETNKDANVYRVYGDDGIGHPAAGQSFTGDGSTLDSVQWYLIKTNGTPTGTGVAKIYAHSGTYGTNSIATGAALATSDNVDITTVTGSYQLITFTFTGANRIVLANGTKYFATFEYTNGDSSNGTTIGGDTSSPAHGGNAASLGSGSWTASGSTDLIFYVNGSPTPTRAGLQVNGGTLKVTGGTIIIR
jgi:hypothetical protein